MNLHVWSAFDKLLDGKEIIICLGLHVLLLYLTLQYNSTRPGEEHGTLPPKIVR